MPTFEELQEALVGKKIKELKITDEDSSSSLTLVFEDGQEVHFVADHPHSAHSELWVIVGDSSWLFE